MLIRNISLVLQAKLFANEQQQWLIDLDIKKSKNKSKET